MTGKHVQLVFNNKNNNTALNDQIGALLDQEITMFDSDTANCFINAFWQKNFDALYKRDALQKNDSINADTYLEIHGEVVFLRYVEIALIKKLKEAQAQVDDEKTLLILQKFQTSDVYKKYLGQNGLDQQLKESLYRRGFGDSTLEKILNAGEIEGNKLISPELTIKETQESEKKTFDQIVKDLESAEGKLRNSWKSIKITEDKQFKQLTQAILMADPMTLAMTMHSAQGKLCIAEMDNVYKKKAIEIGIWTISAACVAVIGIILTPQLTAILGTTALTTVLTKVVLQATGLIVSIEVTKLLKKCLETQELPENPISAGKTKTINEIDINNKQSQKLLAEFNSVTMKVISPDVKTSINIV